MGQRKRILLVMASPFRSGLAPENNVRAKAIYDNPDFDVDIMCFPIGEDIQKENVHIVRVPQKQLFKTFQVGEYKKILYYTICILIKLFIKKDKNYDIVFLFNASYLVFWMINPLFNGVAIPIVYTTLEHELIKWKVTENGWLIRIVKSTENFILKKYVALIFNNRKYIEIFKGRCIKENKMHLIPWACEANFDSIEDNNLKRRPEGIFTILYAGSFVGIQNINLIYDIARNLLDKHVKFILVGADDDEYIREGEKIRFLPNVEIHKRISQTDLCQYYRDADMLISCRTEGYDVPFKIIEYMSWGKCILATDRPIHNLVLNKEIACLVEPESKIMSSIILDLIQNPIKVRQYQSKVRQYFMENHSFQLMKKKYFVLINEISRTIKA